ncbi:MAG: CPBP family intramembrane metalloprotease [Clostridia bacterium]|nr:CPBP family intramembrane metalloprotease [Clostridia bacterium]
MSKYTVSKPQMMVDAAGARFKPRVIIACLISLAIYAAYNIVATIIGLVYVGSEVLKDPGFLQGSFTKMLSSLYDIVLSQTFMLITFFSMVVLIGFVIIQVRAIDRRKLYTIGMTKKRVVRSYLIGIGIGAALLLVMLVPTLITERGSISYNGFRPILIVFLFAFIIQSAAEEILFRGYLMTALGNRVSTFWAVMISSAVFALLHLINGGATVSSIVQVFLLGALFAFYVVRSGNIWGACGMHFAWNFVQGLFTEIRIAGVSMDYSIIKFKNVDFYPEVGNWIGNPTDLIPIALFLVAIALMLFVGKNRIVVKRPRQSSDDTVLS